MGPDRVPNAYSSSDNKFIDSVRNRFWIPRGSGVPRAFHRSKHLILLLFEWASRCYELQTLAPDALGRASSSGMCLVPWTNTQMSSGFPDSTISLSAEPCLPAPMPKARRRTNVRRDVVNQDR